MKKRIGRVVSYLLLAGLTACAGMQRECAGCSAERFGADWIVVQHRADGGLIRCWKLKSTSIDNEEHSDGIWWQSPEGHLVHISGWYNRVQVTGGDWATAARQLGLSQGGEECLR